MKDIEGLFFELIRVAIGTQDTLSRVPTAKEWKMLYAMAKKQSLVGVCFAALQRLGADADEGFARIGMSETLYLTWMGMAVKIQMRNEKMNGQCVELQRMLAENGFRSCILKGQGVARLYRLKDNLNPNLDDNIDLSGLRQSGDIDIWMDGGFEKVNAWVQKVAPTNVVNQHHVALNVFEGTDVEAHYHPINMMNPWRQRLLKKFIKGHEDVCFDNKVCLSQDDSRLMCVPTAEFNLVFLMVHIFHHLFTEGVGLRQIMDYYFVLKASIQLSSERRSESVHMIKQLGMERFAKAMAWVIGYVFDGDPDSPSFRKGLGKGTFEPDEKDGRFLLKEIMKSGNFGKQDERQKGLYDSKWNSFWMVNGKTFRFWRFDLWAWFWSPIERVKGYAWRRLHGYRQY